MEFNQLQKHIKTTNPIIVDTFIKANEVINGGFTPPLVNSGGYEKLSCSISGGADSDVMMDIIHRIDVDNKVEYVWFDTGIEYQATKDHLKYLEERYCVDIIKEKATKPIPASCKEYGQPFISKYVSDMLHRLQFHNFDFKNDGDKSYEELMNKYNNCKGALLWWCNKNGGRSAFNINRNKWLKEFMIENPIWFNVSQKCCEYAKKENIHRYNKNNNIKCNVCGVRKSEGGIRSTTYKNCWDKKGKDEVSLYRPLFWWKVSDKEEYEKLYHIVHSDCYTRYGLPRTGCAGCPFSGIRYMDELETIKYYEPKLYVACNNVFKDSYEYTRMYKEFRDKMNK